MAPEIIPPELESELRSLGVDPRDPHISKVVELTLMVFGGPIPPPSFLAAYDKVVPGLAQRIIGWTEQQRDHRQALERQRVDGSERRMNRGQIIGASVAILGLPLAALVGIFGHPFVASVIAIVSVGGPTAAAIMALAFRRNAFAKKPDKKH